MLITLEFSESQQAFHNRYPQEKDPAPESGFKPLGEIESETASEFVYHMNRYRFNGNRITEEFCRVKWESFLSKQSSITSK